MGCIKQRSRRNFKVWRWRLVHLWKTHQEAKKPLYAPVIEWGEGALCTVDNLGDHHLLITYESVTESSFSEVFLTMVLFSREQCWDTSLLSQLLTRETPLQEYGPWKMGFPLWASTKVLSAFSTRPTMILLSHHLMSHQISDMSSLSSDMFCHCFQAFFKEASYHSGQSKPGKFTFCSYQWEKGCHFFKTRLVGLSHQGKRRDSWQNSHIL